MLNYIHSYSNSSHVRPLVESWDKTLEVENLKIIQSNIISNWPTDFEGKDYWKSLWWMAMNVKWWQKVTWNINYLIISSVLFLNVILSDVWFMYILLTITFSLILKPWFENFNKIALLLIQHVKAKWFWHITKLFLVLVWYIPHWTLQSLLTSGLSHASLTDVHPLSIHFFAVEGPMPNTLVNT